MDVLEAANGNAPSNDVLNAGVMEEGRWTESREGTPQGATASPLLANLYLHYIFDLWIQQWRKKRAPGAWPNP